ncbi:MAG: 4-hydroxy-tetrahydrodipicolinate reductase [Pseudomonadota bacterium]
MSGVLAIAVLGAAGRMGLQTVTRVHEAEDLTLSSALVRRESPLYGRDIGDLAGLGPIDVVAGSTLNEADVLIDFSNAQVLEYWLPQCAERKIPVVSGTTALDEAQQKALDEAAESVPVLWAANMSPGVALLTRLCREVAAALGEQADVEIVEMHHRHKKDSPSGTALALAEAVASARGQTPADVVQVLRQGADASRVPGEIGITGLRGGEVVGDHTVHVALEHERLELTHRAASRAAFVDGALAAARWIVKQPPGRYALTDVYG